MRKEKITLYDQVLNPADILLYLPESLKRRLNHKDNKRIEDAFYFAVMKYQKAFEEKFLDKIVI